MYCVHHISPFGGALGLPESLSCLITGAVQLLLACLPSSKLAPCYKVYCPKLGGILHGGGVSSYWLNLDHNYPIKIEY